MTVSIKFDANQSFQSEAIASVVDLFSGWNSESTSSFNAHGKFGLFGESYTSNGWGISDDDLVENVRRIQSRTRPDGVGNLRDIVPLDKRIPQSQKGSDLRNFNLEMETGTGKTYVYLRTAIELNLQYGLTKFIIVVPSVAIREGVKSSIDLLRPHFSSVYPGLTWDSMVYESKSVNKLREFASAKNLQILIINSASFVRDDNLIKLPTDDLNGLTPISFIQAVNPALILDEPQKLEGVATQRAIAELNPLFTLRYSATHRTDYCMLYRLGPIDAYDLKLVKRIQVLSVSADENQNTAYVELLKVNRSGVPTASIRVNKSLGRTSITVKLKDDLSIVTGLSVYEGWIVEDIEVEPALIRFTNGFVVQEGTSTDTEDDWWRRAQIAATIEEALEKELVIRRKVDQDVLKPMKVLTLFFIDKVAHYVKEESKYRRWFEELYTTISAKPIYKKLNLPPADKVHRGYFATKSGGVAKDSNGKSAEDKEAYDLIMRNKQQLLSIEEPVRFIFSHSALSEGWDNPNVFVICNLQETRSDVKRRQQIGRGLRLPVMSNGERTNRDDIAWLTVIATESFENFAKKLQVEIEEETGEKFGERIKRHEKPIPLKLKPEALETPEFKALWESIKPRTTYSLEFADENFVELAEARFRKLGVSDPLVKPRIYAERAKLDMDAASGIQVGSTQKTQSYQLEVDIKVPDILRDLASHLGISRTAIHEVIKRSGRTDEAKINPASFRNQLLASLQAALADLLVRDRGILYEKIDPDEANSGWDARLFEQKMPEALPSTLVELKNGKTIYDSIPVDSNVERKFALDLDDHPEIKFFLKLPDWFKVDTPIGRYNPDWAILRELLSGETKLYLVRETKGSPKLDHIFRETERWKVTFGRRHFDAIEVDYKVVKTVRDLDVDQPDQVDV
jgi:type III restriction enzyme